MKSKSEKQQVLDVLNYWFFLDFMSQDALPRPYKKPKDKGVKNIYIKDFYNPSNGVLNNPRNRITDSIEERLASLEKARGVPRSTYLHLGAIPREPIVAYLWGKDDKRVDREVDLIAGALLGITSTGAFLSFELSPVLWAVSSKKYGHVDIHEYENRNETITAEISERFGNEPLTFNDIKEITAKYVAPFLRPVEKAGQLEDSMMSERLASVLIDYAVSDKEDFSYEVSFRSFFAKDIAALKSCVDESSSLEAFDSGQLKLVARYLTAGFDGKAKKARESERVEVLGDCMNPDVGSAFYYWALDFCNIPLGRWPSKYSLSLMQQTAVDLVSGRVRGQFAANDIMSVNGPPGTGKTTLLKDIIAANIVEKAYLLSSYEGKPDDAFEDVQLSKSYLKYAPTVHRFKDELINDLGIIVCSSNNAAVENISKELPNAGGLLGGMTDEEAHEFLDDKLSNMKWPVKDERWTVSKRDIYFSYAAFNQFKEYKDKVEIKDFDDSNNSNLDLLLAARLGKKQNRTDFALNSLNAIPIHKKGALSQNYWAARRLFLEQYDKVKGEMEEITAADRQSHISKRDLLVLKNAHKDAKAGLEKAESDCLWARERASEIADMGSASFDVHVDVMSLEAFERSVNDLRENLARVEVDRCALIAAVEAAETEENQYSAAFMTKARLKIFGKDGQLAQAREKVAIAKRELAVFDVNHRQDGELANFISELDRAAADWSKKACRVDELRRSLEHLQRKIGKKERAYVRQDMETYRLKVWAAGEEEPYSDIGSGRDLVADLSGKGSGGPREAHLFNPVAGKELMHDRDLLFLRALQFTREFILSSSCMRDNFAHLKAYWGLKATSKESGKAERIKFEDADKKAIAPVVFQALNVLTPVVSTTFASAQAMFEDIPIKSGGKAPLGLLVIDEAGQAVPYAALGVLSRCRRAMVVGDPYQIEPVVPQEAKALRSAMASDINTFYKGDIASVQKFADELNPYGQKRYQAIEGGYEESVWVGCPLVVHRRCASPMFDISNIVSYQGGMINETPMLDPSRPGDKEKLDSFYLPSSQWLNVVGSERGNKDHYVEEQGKRVVEIVATAFDRRIDKEKVPSLYIIAPFKTVVRGVKQVLQGKGARPRGVDKKLWEKFIDNNIGTVHTFQGKEALEVVFVLGCDARADGAVHFVNPNIVNVAASRAKQRLYVVGDYRVWQKNPSVSTMKKILDTAWVKHWEAYRETGDKNELRLAREMAPMGESIPYEIKKTEDGDEKVYEIDSYIENMSEYTDRLLRESDCSQYGLISFDEIERMLATCADDGKNKAIGFAKQGIVEYYTKVCGSREVDEDYDLSPVLIMFDKVAEEYLDRRLLPTLKAALPDYKFSKSTSLADQKKLTMGMYEQVVGKKQSPDVLAWRTGLVEADSVGADRLWWKSMSKSLGKFRGERNKSAHLDIVHLGDLEVALRCLGIKRAEKSGDDLSFVTILGHDDVFEAAMRGVAVENVEEPDFGDVTVKAEDLPLLEATEREVTSPSEAISADAMAFSLAGCKSPDGDEGCLSFSRLASKNEKIAGLKQTVCGGKQYASAVLPLLNAAGFIEERWFEGVFGKYPTEAGAKLGIKWRQYGDGAGVVFDSKAQTWLADNLLNLYERYGGQS